MDNKKKICNYTFVSVMLWGLLAHGFIFFNKISVHDDPVSMFSVGQTFYSGRWVLGIMDIFSKHTMAGSFSLPLFNGIITLLLICLILTLLFDMLEIEDRYIIFALSGIFTVYPSLTTLFAYIYTAPHYFIGFMICVLANRILPKYRNYAGIALSALCLSFAIGIYQSSITVYMSVAGLMVLKSLYNENTGFKDLIKITAKHLLCAVFGTGLYIMINKIFLFRYGLHNLTDYQGMSSFGLTSASGYIKRLLVSMHEFIYPGENIRDQIYPFGSYYIFILIVFVYFVVLILGVRSFWVKRKKSKAAFLLMTGAIFPVITNSIFIICDANVTIIHSIMMYSNVFFYPAVFLIPGYSQRPDMKHILFREPGYAKLFLAAVVCIEALIYARYANVCYLKAEIYQTENMAWFNTLINSIKNAEGYKDEYPVVYIGEGNIADLSMPDIPEFDVIKSYPYTNDNLSVNDYSWRQFMKIWCGYSPEELDSRLYSENTAVINMPFYPDDGSIDIIDNAVIVKFANE